MQLWSLCLSNVHSNRSSVIALHCCHLLERIVSWASWLDSLTAVVSTLSFTSTFLSLLVAVQIPGVLLPVVVEAAKIQGCKRSTQTNLYGNFVFPRRAGNKRLKDARGGLSRSILQSSTLQVLHISFHLSLMNTAIALKPQTQTFPLYKVFLPGNLQKV